MRWIDFGLFLALLVCYLLLIGDWFVVPEVEPHREQALEAQRRRYLAHRVSHGIEILAGFCVMVSLVCALGFHYCVQRLMSVLESRYKRSGISPGSIRCLRRPPFVTCLLAAPFYGLVALFIYQILESVLLTEASLWWLVAVAVGCSLIGHLLHYGPILRDLRYLIVEDNHFQRSQP